MWLHTTDTDAVLREAVDLHKPNQDIVAYFPLYHHILHGVKRHFASNQAHRLCLISARWESLNLWRPLLATRRRIRG